jgi:diguanylate cyclase (GGDEF)-like protein/PAS domain S-box-containing protein
MSKDCLTRPVPGGHPDNDLAAQAAMYRVIIENTVDVIIRYNAEQRRVYVSPASFDMFGYTPVELLESQAGMMIHPEDFVRVHPHFLKVGPGCPRLHLTFKVSRKDGVYIWVEGQYRYLAEDGGSVAVLRDVTARKQAEEMRTQATEQLEAANHLLQALANQDGLTGLANRRYFDQTLQEEFRRARRQELPLAVLMIDVDSFKSYNDRYGHLSGDECLRLIARTIEGIMRRPSDHAARYGGEEFVVLLPATDTDGALMVAERIRCAVSAIGIAHLGNPFGIATISIGVSSVTPSSGDHSADQLIYAADCALYQAKAEGRNRVRSGSLTALEAAS